MASPPDETDDASDSYEHLARHVSKDELHDRSRGTGSMFYRMRCTTSSRLRAGAGSIAFVRTHGSSL